MDCARADTTQQTPESLVHGVLTVDPPVSTVDDSASVGNIATVHGHVVRDDIIASAMNAAAQPAAIKLEVNCIQAIACNLKQFFTLTLWCDPRRNVKKIWAIILWTCLRSWLRQFFPQLKHA